MLVFLFIDVKSNLFTLPMNFTLKKLMLKLFKRQRANGKSEEKTSLILTFLTTALLMSKGKKLIRNTIG